MTIEKRLVKAALEVRKASSSTGTLKLSGYAIRYDEPSERLEHGFREVIKPGAFSESIASRNIVALHQHDDKQLLGSTQSGTLRLTEETDGISFELDLLETRKDLYDLVERGDLSGVSFGFTVTSENFNDETGDDIREVVTGELYEISLVHTAAYPTATVVAQRSLERYNTYKKENENMAEQQTNIPEIEPTVMQRAETPKANEVRAYKPGELMGDDTTTVVLGDLVRAAVTGEGTKEVREMLNTTNTGAILVPKKVMNNMIDLMRKQSFLLKGATTVDMQNHQTVSVPKVLTQPTAAFKKPGEEIVKSDPTFDEVKLDAKYLYAMTEVPLELMKTGVGVAEKLNYLIGKAMSEAIEAAALSGAVDGFEGIFNDTDIQAATFDTLDYNAIKEGVKKVAAENGHANDLVLSTNNKLDLETLQATDLQYITPPPFYQALTKHATNIMDDEHILVGDLSSVYLGVLQNMTVEVSREYGFNKGTVAIRIYWYGDVVVSEPKQLCLMTKTGA